jgi:FMN reductase
MRILGIAGSLRQGSHTERALRIALSGAAIDIDTIVASGDVLRLPLCDGEHEPTGAAGDAVRTWRAMAQQADGYIWATPEYHGAMSGVLKNALDWLGRDHLGGKPVGLVGVAGGAFGGLEALTMLRVVARSAHADAIVDQAVVPSVGRAFAGVVDAKLEARLRAVGAGVAAAVQRRKS